MGDHHFYIPMKIYVIITVIVAALAFGAYSYRSSYDIPSKNEMVKEAEGIMKKVDEAKDVAIEKGAAMIPGTYKVSEGELVPGKKNLLYFFASWCPTCRAADANIKANLVRVPSGLVIHQIDYDTATDLKKKYGVTYQHTFVQVDEKGEMITKWSGGDLAAIVAKLK